ncbi:MAG TPA: hypothetical protein VG826_34265 [Pirellulales bacterium]|nr:hypothetical protein [Pirellulales bacterium]
MMRSARLAVIALSASAVGALPGILCAWGGAVRQGAGVAVIGALIALGIAFSSILYGTTRSAALGRIAKGVVCLLVVKNIHGGAELFEFRDEVVPRSNFRVPREKLERRMNWGMAIGGCLGGLGALVAFVGWWASGGELQGDQKIAAPIAFPLLGFIVGGCYGAALGMLTVRGGHRRNLALGAGVGLAIGIALGTAAGSQNPSWLPYFFIAAMFTTIGLGCGIIAPENFAGTPGDEEPPPDDMEQSRQRLRRLTSVREDPPPRQPSDEPRIEVRRKPSVDGPASSESKLSGWTVFLMVCSVIVLLIPLFALTQQRSAEEQRRREEQRELQRKVEQAILDGSAGPVLRRLYGVEDDPPGKRPSATEKNASALRQAGPEDDSP